MQNQRFKLLKEIHKSNYSITYLASDKRTRKQVIIKKLIFGNLDNWKAFELFEREAGILRQLDHPCIPDFIDYFTEKDDSSVRFFLVQSFFQGQNLRKFIAENERLSEDKALSYLKKLLAILKYIHSLNPPVIHRDIKPDNIIIAQNSIVALVDFGSVKTIEKNDMTIVGTYGYMPLEQFGGEAYPSSDIYALGMVMVFWLTHREPGELLKQRGRITFRDETTISDELYQVLIKMVEPDHTLRYQDVSAIELDLANLHDTGKSKKIPAPGAKLKRDKQTESLRQSAKEKNTFKISIVLTSVFFAVLATILINKDKNIKTSRVEMDYLLKIEHNEKDIYRNRTPVTHIEPLPGGFQKAEFGMSLREIKKIYPDLRGYLTAGPDYIKIDRYLKKEYFNIPRQAIWLRKSEIYGFNFDTFFLIKDNHFICAVSVLRMDTKEVFQKLEENILDFLEKKYGFPQKAKVKNKSISYGSHSRDDYYIWKDQRMELKVNVHSYVPDPILKDILKIQGDFIFVLEYTSQEEIKKIEEEERKKDEESKKNLEERQKKEAERVEKLNERLRNSDSKPDL